MQQHEAPRTPLSGASFHCTSSDVKQGITAEDFVVRVVSRGPQLSLRGDEQGTGQASALPAQALLCVSMTPAVFLYGILCHIGVTVCVPTCLLSFPDCFSLYL